MKRFLLLIALLALAAFCLFPFFWSVLTAFKSPAELSSLPVTWWPEHPTLENFVNVFGKRDFAAYVFNSLTAGFLGTLLTLFLAALTAYRLRNMAQAKAMAIQKFLLLFAIIPPTLLVIPLFLAVKGLGLANSHLGLALAYTFLNYPFAVWMLAAAFQAIPKSLDEAALLDGFSRRGLLFRILLPLAAPAAATAGMLVFIFNWNEFLVALTLMPDQSMYTVPVGVAMLSGASVYELPWGEINAAVTVTTLPVIALVALFQRWIVSGLTSGAVKG